MTTTLSKRQPRPCSLRVAIAATGEHGTAYVQWADGDYAVKLTNGAWVDVPAGQLTFLRNEAA